MCHCAFILLSVYIPAHLTLTHLPSLPSSLLLSLCLSACPCFYLNVPMSIRSSVCRSDWLSVCLSVHICVFLCLLVCLSLCLFLSEQMSCGIIFGLSDCFCSGEYVRINSCWIDF